MREKTIILLGAILVFALLVSIPLTKGAPFSFKRVGNKIYQSAYVKNMFLIAPDDNTTIGRYCTYDIYFICTNSKNYSVRYNETAIGYKLANQTALIIRFFANDSAFNINVVETGNNNSIEYIKVFYYAQGGIIIIPPPTPPFDGENQTFEKKFLGISYTDLGTVVFYTILGCILGLFLMGITIKITKEHIVVEKETSGSMEFYRKRDKSKGGGLFNHETKEK